MRKKRRKKQSKDRVRRGYTLADIDEVWIRWQRGESLKAIGRVFGKEGSSVYGQIAPYGGICPRTRCRSKRALTLAVVCVKFCKKYFQKIQFLSVDRRRACGNVGKLSVLGEAFPSLRGNPRLLADFL